MINPCPAPAGGGRAQHEVPRAATPRSPAEPTHPVCTIPRGELEDRDITPPVASATAKASLPTARKPTAAAYYSLAKMINLGVYTGKTRVKGPRDNAKDALRSSSYNLRFLNARDEIPFIQCTTGTYH